MQYVLNEEEYTRLKNNCENAEQLIKNSPDLDKLQKFCTHIADTVEAKEGWAKGKPWGCILTVKGEHYCDCCPAQEVCPYPHKEWSNFWLTW